MVLISGDFYNHLTNDVYVVIDRPLCQCLTPKQNRNEVLSITEIHLLENIFGEDFLLLTYSG